MTASLSSSANATAQCFDKRTGLKNQLGYAHTHMQTLRHLILGEQVRLVEVSLTLGEQVRLVEVNLRHVCAGLVEVNLRHVCVGDHRVDHRLQNLQDLLELVRGPWLAP